MRLLKTPILLLVISIFFFSSCEPTYDELVEEQVDLLVGKTWEQVTPACSEESFSYNLIFNEDYSAVIERTYLGYDNNGNRVMMTETDYVFNWYIQENYLTMLFTIHADNYTFNVISVEEDRLTFTDYSNSTWSNCIHELK